MKYRLAMFDFDGTLADTLPWMRSMFNALADAHGFRRVEPCEYEHFRNLNGVTLLRELKLPLWKLPRVINDMRRRMAGHKGRFSLFAGVGEVLHHLSISGCQLAIVSSNSRENVERVLGAGHASLFAHPACGVSMFGKGGKLRQVVRGSGIPPELAIYLGDEIRDAAAARHARVAFGAVTWGQHDEQVLRAHHPAEVFRTPQEIAERLC